MGCSIYDDLQDQNCLMKIANLYDPYAWTSFDISAPAEQGNHDSIN
jgi:hypothetical protein